MENFFSFLSLSSSSCSRMNQQLLFSLSFHTFSQNKVKQEQTEREPTLKQLARFKHNFIFMHALVSYYDNYLIWILIYINIKNFDLREWAIDRDVRGKMKALFIHRRFPTKNNNNIKEKFSYFTLFGFYFLLIIFFLQSLVLLKPFKRA